MGRCGVPSSRTEVTASKIAQRPDTSSAPRTVVPSEVMRPSGCSTELFGARRRNRIHMRRQQNRRKRLIARQICVKISCIAADGGACTVLRQHNTKCSKPPPQAFTQFTLYRA